MINFVLEPEPNVMRIWSRICMRIRSRICMRIWSRIIYEDPEPNYYEDPEPNYYFCINNDNFVIVFIFRVRSRIFRIRRCIITLLVIISLVFLRIRSRIIIYQK